jgi:hypothetical protein
VSEGVIRLLRSTDPSPFPAEAFAGLNAPLHGIAPTLIDGRAPPVVNGGTTARHTWWPIDLLNTGRTPPPKPAISMLLYAARRHVISGDTESLKSMLALILFVEQLHAGNSVFYIDLEMGDAMLLERLTDLGATDEQIRDKFVYLRPTDALTTTAARDDMRALLLAADPSLVVIDSFTGALALHNLKEEAALDIERFYQNVADELTAGGAALLLLDHLPKDRENRGVYAIGSQRKIAGVDVHLGMKVERPLTRGGIGLATITTLKDRGGYLARPKAAELHLASNPDDGRITWRFSTAEREASNHTEPFKPTILMARLSKHLGTVREPLTRTELAAAVPGNRAYKFDAIKRLIADGYAEETTGGKLQHLRRFQVPDQFPPVPGNRSGGTGSPVSPSYTEGNHGTTPDPAPVLPPNEPETHGF